MTWRNLVRRYFPKVTDEECDCILWEKTAFPVASVETVEQQLKELSVLKS